MGKDPTFKADLIQLLRSAKERRNREEQDARDFQAEWDKLRSSTILPVLSEAEEALEEAGFGGESGPDNGAAVLRAVRQEDKTFLCDLAFRKGIGSRGERVVILSCSLPDVREEPFSIVYVNDSFVKEKVRWFIQTLTKGVLSKARLEEGNPAKRGNEAGAGALTV